MARRRAPAENTGLQRLVGVPGTANNAPTTAQQIKNPNTADLTTISHCARTITGLRIRVSGTPNAGTACTMLKPRLISVGVRRCRLSGLSGQWVSVQCAAISLQCAAPFSRSPPASQGGVGDPSCGELVPQDEASAARLLYAVRGGGAVYDHEFAGAHIVCPLDTIGNQRLLCTALAAAGGAITKSSSRPNPRRGSGCMRGGSLSKSNGDIG